MSTNFTSLTVGLTIGQP